MTYENLKPTDESDTFGLMFSLQADGSYSTSEHDGVLLSFEHAGMAITNPCIDESSVVPVHPRYYGFNVIDHRAGAALRLELEGGDYLLLTNLGAAEPARLSRCDQDGKVLVYCFLADVP